MAKDVETGGSFSAKDYQDPPPAPLIDSVELTKWSFYRAIIAEFIATLLFLYITVLTVIGYKSQTDPALNGVDCGGVGILGIAWAFGGMIFILVYCTAGISGQSSLSISVYGLVSECVCLLRIRGKATVIYRKVHLGGPPRRNFAGESKKVKDRSQETFSLQPL